MWLLCGVCYTPDYLLAGAGQVLNGSPLATLVPSVTVGRAVLEMLHGLARGSAPSLGACVGHVTVTHKQAVISVPWVEHLRRGRLCRL